ncbi:MAG: universal stress protein [bacterium]|nr:universal stress protein [bacterium]
MAKFAPKKILVPIDFSNSSYSALEAATGIAELRNAEITVIHVMAEPATSVPYEVYIDWEKVKLEIRADAEKRITEMCEKGCPGIACKKELVWGDAATAIAAKAEEEGYDMIVMATHGRTGLPRLFIGSVAESVIRHVPCPVLTIRVPA